MTDHIIFGGSKQESTTFRGGNGGYGSFFTVTARTLIRIVTIDFHSDKAENPLHVEIFTKRGDYKGYERNAMSWAPVVNTTVTGAGRGQRTIIPPGRFTPVIVSTNQSQSFFISLDKEDLRYTNTGRSVGSVFLRTVDLDFSVGEGVSGYPAFNPTNHLFGRRIFNGIIHYQRALRDTPQRVDSALYQFGKTFTQWGGGSRGSGIMFELDAVKPMILMGMDCHMDTTLQGRLEIWTKEGQFRGYENSMIAWKRVIETWVVGRGQDELTPIPGLFDPPIFIDEGQTHSFYLTTQDPTLVYSVVDSRTQPVGSVYVDNSDLRLITGAGVSHRFRKIFSPRVFSGNIYYKVNTTTPSITAIAAPTWAPTKSPLADANQIDDLDPPELLTTEQVSQQRITVRGQFSKTINYLSPSSIHGFEEAAAAHVEHFVTRYGLVMKGVYVSFPSIDEISTGSNGLRSLLQSRLLRSTFDDGGAERPDNVVKEAVERGMTTAHKVDKWIDVYTTFAADCSGCALPHAIDFNELVNDSCNRHRDQFVDELKESHPVFSDVAEVLCTPVSFPMPWSSSGTFGGVDKPPPISGNKSSGRIILFSVLVAFFCLVGLFALLVLLLRQRKRKVMLRQEASSLGTGHDAEGNRLE